MFGGDMVQTFLPEHRKGSDYEGGDLARDFCLSVIIKKGRFYFYINDFSDQLKEWTIWK
ncbi:hypothetical protein JCM21714_1357 [Gracilibacillus boraciitolerans JCM 21714]|uniref:Uncharacterized protein n=1 Tax=Gracilibacillus boraciitolerans JCM 21714 TaxID=1298598 RepID=W4VGS0_9BACI|nr:hypothetical protein JCM21714_1357 [Gracilibacillus boraciitolerans JCM 21714]